MKVPKKDPKRRIWGGGNLAKVWPNWQTWQKFGQIGQISARLDDLRADRGEPSAIEPRRSRSPTPWMVATSLRSCHRQIDGRRIGFHSRRRRSRRPQPAFTTAPRGWAMFSAATHISNSTTLWWTSARRGDYTDDTSAADGHGPRVTWRRQ